MARCTSRYEMGRPVGTPASVMTVDRGSREAPDTTIVSTTMDPLPVWLLAATGATTKNPSARAPTRSRRMLRLGAGQHSEDELIAFRAHVHLDLVARREIAGQDLLGERILHVALQRALERASPEMLIVPVLHQEVRGCLGQVEGIAGLGHAGLHLGEQDAHDQAYVRAIQGVEYDDVVEPVEELGIEDLVDLVLHLVGDAIERGPAVRLLEAERLFGGGFRRGRGRR